MNKPLEIYFEKRFFKAYFAGSLIYAAVFGCLTFPWETPENHSDEESAGPLSSFLFAFLSVIVFSLLNAGLMKWLGRRSSGMICLSAFLNWLMVVLFVYGFMVARRCAVAWRYTSDMEYFCFRDIRFAAVGYGCLSVGCRQLCPLHSS